MSAATAPADEAPAKPKSKKLLFILIGVVVLALAGAGGAYFLLKKNHAEDGEGEGDGASEAKHEPAPVEYKQPDPKAPPTFLPLDSMVVNLADPGGNRFAQLTITLQLLEPKVAEDMKLYMPSIRNGILIAVSQRTADEMLAIKGKERLTQDIIAEISYVMGYEMDEPETEAAAGKKKRRRAPPNPVQGVLFTSFIVQ